MSQWEEAMYNGLYEMDKNIQKYGCVNPNEPKYNNEIWKDVCGKVRNIKDMDSMHLCFIAKQCECSKSKSLKQHKLPKIIEELKFRIRNKLFSKEDFDFHIEGIRVGLYCFYPNEHDTGLENYYMNMLKTYPYFNPPKLLFENK